MKTIYRLHISCPAHHTTYIDYSSKRAATRNLVAMRDTTTWYATHIEILRG